MRLLVSSLLLLVLFAGTSSPFFTTEGKKIVDSNGQPVLLRGLGLGGWLVPEGYMLHIPGYGSPTYIDSLITDLIGSQNRDQFWELYRAYYVNETDVRQISQWGFNSIRLPFHYNVFYDANSDNFKEVGFLLLDELLSWCKQNNLYLILDMHCAPGGQNKDNISDSDGIEARLWTESANRDLTIRIWQEIARRYKNEPQIVGYDLLNEPVLPAGYSNTVLRDFYVQLTDSIRKIDTNHIVFIEGNWYATDFNELTPPFDDNMVYSFHKYWSSTTEASIRYLLDIRDQYNVPLWMGESGENSNPWFWEAVQLFENHNIGWCWWTHKKFQTLTSPRSVPMNEAYQQILDYWRDQGSRPPQTIAKQTLFEMAENLAIEKCETRPGVLKALFDPNFGSDAQPFTQLSVPGIINAVHYDFGSNAAGYMDKDFKNEAGPGGATWNKGWQFRNDGVDIEESSDTQGYPYNVGWIEEGEWLKYTIDVQSEGVYGAKFRVAGNSGGGSIRLYLDNEKILDHLSVPNTGGWQNWQTIQADSIFFSAGKHTFYVSFVSGGFNLNRMEFTLQHSGFGNENNGVPHEFELGQNYPNPFNPTTTIPFLLPETAFVEIGLYAVDGRMVTTLLKEWRNAGKHEIKFNGNKLASGIYTYRMKAGNHVLARNMLLIR